MAFPQRFLDELIDRSDIVDVVSSYVALTRKGSNYFGLCPFHNEKTGSFSVAPDKQMYYCFGCHKGGGAINFIMEIENLAYPDAIRFLAKRANMRSRRTTRTARNPAAGSGCWPLTRTRPAGFTRTSPGRRGRRWRPIGSGGRSPGGRP